jgi:hypothetical protein
MVVMAVAWDVVVPAVPSTLGPAERRHRRPSGRLCRSSLVVAATTAWLLAVGIETLRREGRLVSGLRAGWVELARPALLAVVALVVLCERRWPAQPRCSPGATSTTPASRSSMPRL